MDLPVPWTKKEVMKLNGMSQLWAASFPNLQIDATNSLTYLKDARISSGLKTVTAFKLKKHLGSPPLLIKLNPYDILQLYLTDLDNAVISILTENKGKKQHLIYYVSKTLLDAKSRYTSLEKLILALVVSMQKLKSYFQSHTLKVLIAHLTRSVLHNLDLNRRTIV